MDLAAELKSYGPGVRAKPSLSESQTYCRRLAESHYENFTVVSWLWPRHLHQHLCNVYAYCRWADDLADETGDSERSLELLDWWQQSLEASGSGEATHPVFVALAETMREFDLDERPFVDLLSAFRRDQRQHTYETFDELLDYCRCSANPVGRIVLHLGRSIDEENARLSDSICTGLQLANFWQDVKRDCAIGRVYLPLEDCRRYAVEPDRLEGPVAQEMRELLAMECERAKGYLLAGEGLVRRVSSDLRWPVRLFIDGGQEIVRAIERQQYDVWSHRPVVGKWSKLRLLASGWFKTRWN